MDFNPFGQLLQSRQASDQFNLQRNALAAQQAQNQNAFARQRRMDDTEASRYAAQQSRQSTMDQREEARYGAEQSQKLLQVFGPVAAKLANMEPARAAAVYPGIAQWMKQSFPQVPLPAQWNEEAQQGAAALAQAWEATQAPQKQAAFTLGAGQTRYDAEGNPIASVPAKAESYPDLTGDAKNLAATLGRRPTLEELKDYKKSGAVSIELTPGQKKVDEKYSDDYLAWRAAGGFADVNKQLGQLEEVAAALEGGKENLTGPVIGKTPDVALALLNPRSVETRETVEEVVQRSLRATLGAQFTEREAERLIARAYNPKLDEASNAKRLRRLILQIRAAAEAKDDAANFFEEHGTLNGWDGKKYTITDFYAAMGNGPKGRLTDNNIATEYMRRANGDKEQARKLARNDGWEF